MIAVAADRDQLRQLVRDRPAALHFQFKLGGAPVQRGFELRVALQPARDALHALAEPFRTRVVAGTLQPGALALHRLLTRHESIGARVRNESHALFLGHRPRRAARVAAHCLLDQLRIALHRGCEVAPSASIARHAAVY